MKTLVEQFMENLKPIWDLILPTIPLIVGIVIAVSLEVSYYEEQISPLRFLILQPIVYLVSAVVFTILLRRKWKLDRESRRLLNEDIS